MDAAAVVLEARDFEPVALRIDHPPPREVVERGAPQHGLLAARVHCDVAADDGCVRGRRVDREDEAGCMSRLLDASGDHTRFGEHGGDRLGDARQCRRLDAIDALKLLDVDDRCKRREWYRAAGVARAAAAGNHGEAGLEAGAHEPRDLSLGIGHQHDEGRLHPPVGGIRCMRDARIGVEADVVAARMGGKSLARTTAQGFGGGEGRRELRDRRACELEQLADFCVADGVRRVTPLFDVRQAMLQRFDQQLAPLRVVEQVLLQVRVAPHDPDVAQYLVQHARRASGAPLRAQVVEQFPTGCAEQPDHDLAVRERSVVVGNLAQPRGRFQLYGGRRGGRGAGR